MSTPGQWDPNQYNRFASEREQPFWDLVALLEPTRDPEVVDLGCGDGRLTAALHRALSGRQTSGVDSSPEMLARATQHAGATLSFEAGDLSVWPVDGADVVFSNAALHWVPDHSSVLRRIRDELGPGGQVAVQVPANPDHPSHEVARCLAEEWLGAAAPRDPVADHVLPPEAYAELLAALGFVRQHVRLQVYGHRLPRSSDVVEWVKGTSLTRFSGVFSPEEYERFLAEYRRRLLDVIGDRDDYFYAFKRILFWGRLD